MQILWRQDSCHGAVRDTGDIERGTLGFPLWGPDEKISDKPMRDWPTVTRKDGTRQWACKGMPLYTWIKDMKPGDATGDGAGNGAWKVAMP
jgi:predicted lipoprotein with Yx(FWY)xxD motif